jgi:hypothetical protein
MKTKTTKTSRYLLGVLLLILAICSTGFAITLFDSGAVAIANGDPTQAGRLARAVHNPSDWSQTTAFPGTANAGVTYHYRTFTIPASVMVNTPFVQVFIDDQGPVNLGPFLSAYANSYDPTNEATNYLGDEGFSGNFPGDRSFFQLHMTPGQDLVVLVNGTQGGAGGANDVGKPYRVVVEGFTDTLYSNPSTPTPTPTPKPSSPAISIAVTPASVKEGKKATFTFTASPVAHPAITVNFQMSGQASNVPDYTLNAGTSVFMNTNQATATVVLTSKTDALNEGSETAIMKVVAGTGYTIGSPNQATVLIKDN